MFDLPRVRHYRNYTPCQYPKSMRILTKLYCMFLASLANAINTMWVNLRFMVIIHKIMLTLINSVNIYFVKYVN